ncbi:MAG TPA: PP2C family serine/threonine-protein phosphatase [Acidimicrobiia bacterium]|nr:PP2C family serine/threonine-protein phosphatase [Acidimicrobiia bacterium]
MKYVWASATHKGMVRQNNEDSLYPEKSGESEGPVVLMVADGMGGHVAGEVASRLAVNAAASSSLEPGDRVAAANRAIREEVARQPDLEGMGTTMTLVELTPEGVAHFGHVGDSRAYLFRDGGLKQLTADHTVAAEMVALGQITAEEAEDHPRSHMIVRCLGLTRFVNVDEIEHELEPGDRILLCSDGLNSMVPQATISQTLGEGTADEVAWRLIELANKAGGHDNITIILIDVLS